MQFGGLGIPSVLFADDVVFLSSSVHDLQHSLDHFAVECEAARMRISTSGAAVAQGVERVVT